MTDQQIAALKEAAEKATSGEWKHQEFYSGGDKHGIMYSENKFLGEELDDAVDVLKARYDAAMQEAKK